MVGERPLMSDWEGNQTAAPKAQQEVLLSSSPVRSGRFWAVFEDLVPLRLMVPVKKEPAFHWQTGIERVHEKITRSQRSRQEPPLLLLSS